MIYEIIIILALVGIFIILGRKMSSMKKELQLPEISESLLSQAETCFQNKNFPRAEELYIKLAAKDPTDPKIYNRLGIIYLEEKNFSDAKDAFLMAIKHGGEKASRYYNLALAYLGREEFRNALEAGEKALELEPDHSKYKDFLQDIRKRLEPWQSRKQQKSSPKER